MPKNILILGASGLVGNAALNYFLSQKDWEVTAVSRRKPETESSRFFRHLSIDLTNEKACRQAFSALKEIQYVVYAALAEKTDDLVAGWFDPIQMQLNRTMLYNVLEPLCEAAKGLKHLNLLQGTKAYGVHIHSVPIPLRESLPRDQHENFYWLQEDYLRKKAQENGFAFTIVRPALIIGAAYGGAMSLLPVIGAYAAICHELGEPFCFPGGSALNVIQVVDARLLAQFFAWAATEAKAANQTFNISNGDVAEWHNLWPALANTLGVKLGPDQPRSMKTFLPTHAPLWEIVVQKYQLRKISMQELLGVGSHHFADVMFAYGEKEMRPPAFISEIALRKAGFCEFLDTESSFCELLAKLIEQRILPHMQALFV